MDPPPEETPPKASEKAWTDLYESILKTFKRQAKTEPTAGGEKEWRLLEEKEIMFYKQEYEKVVSLGAAEEQKKITEKKMEEEYKEKMLDLLKVADAVLKHYVDPTTHGGRESERTDRYSRSHDRERERSLRPRSFSEDRTERNPRDQRSDPRRMGREDLERDTDAMGPRPRRESRIPMREDDYGSRSNGRGSTLPQNQRGYSSRPHGSGFTRPPHPRDTYGEGSRRSYEYEREDSYGRIYS